MPAASYFKHTLLVPLSVTTRISENDRRSLEGGKKIGASRQGSFDIIFDDGDLHYHDSFVGFSDFCGQEHVTHKSEPVWSMVYYGYLLAPDKFSGTEAVTVLKNALSKMYGQGRFLGGGLVYELIYCGGTVRK